MSRIEKAMERAAQLREGGGVAPAPAPAPAPAGHQQKHVFKAIPSQPPPAPSVTPAITSDNPYLVNLNDPHSPTAEEYRKLKSVLVKMTKGEDFFKNTIMVTSAVPHEGKTLTALNLAISLAQEFDHTVLLVDADLRRPSVQRYLNMNNKRGLSDVLLEGLDIGDAIVATGIGKLSLIPAGRAVSNPVELFTSQKMKELIEEMKYRYPDRYLIFDTPPILPFAETRSLANLMDGVLFVVKERLASQENVKEAVEALKGCELLGLVYNDATLDRHDERYSYYRDYSPKAS
ncbi:tyrosine-protein kinase family protein [Geobacter sp. FeAm09]|uniref:XrtA-associated tyrosine autokinase n=1 Tax=Geobacter sp. FeAm09 TaxID=2597769 RepID=UPI0011EC89AB|nr:XrtA-associated tyrosine autokinase [Geobacter sp. FeAm09]QEM68673.1 tyrosine-protein kinase family protein [Geobacter sp. FeAm09]